MILFEEKKEYKKLEIRQKRQYQRYEGNMIEYLRKYDLKEFHKYFSRDENQTLGQISMNQFVNHFKNLSSSTNIEADNSDINIDTIPADYKELDVEISNFEIDSAIRLLKRNTSCSEDFLLNELFKDCKDVLLPHLSNLFNSIFSSGFCPSSWSKVSLF
jgi:hypothetical protein